MSQAVMAVCYICGKEFAKQSYCNRHIKAMHKTTGEPVEPARKVTCVLCGKEFSQKSTLRRHINTVHNSENKQSVPELKCDYCDYKTFFKSNLKRHCLKVHQGPNPKLEKKLKCSKCLSKFSSLKCLKYHEKKRHMPENAIKVFKRICPLCNFVTLEASKAAIYKHFEVDHNIALDWQTYTFSSMMEFKVWKENLQKDNAVFYCAKFESKSKNTLHYTCHRSGKYVTKGANIRRLKSIGSCKINAYCPSAMKVKKENDSVSVKYLPVHVGHDTDPKHVRPSLGGLGCGKKYKQVMRSHRGIKATTLEKTNIEENTVIVAVIDENNDVITNEGVIEEVITQEVNDEMDMDNNVSEPLSYNEDHDTMLYLEKVKLFQEFREFEGFLQKNVTSIEQIEYVRREIVKMVTNVNVLNSTSKME